MKTYIQPTTTIIATAMQSLLAGSPKKYMRFGNAKEGTVSENTWDDEDADDPNDIAWSKGVKVWGEDE